MTLKEFKEYYGNLSPVVKVTDIFKQDVYAYDIPEEDIPEAQAFVKEQILEALKDPIYQKWIRKQLEAKRDRLLKRGKIEEAKMVTYTLEKL